MLLRAYMQILQRALPAPHAAGTARLQSSGTPTSSSTCYGAAQAQGDAGVLLELVQGQGEHCLLWRLPQQLLARCPQDGSCMHRSALVAMHMP